MEDTDIEKENISESPKNSGENKKPDSADQIGSEEFYQGERVIEDIALPGKKKNIKAKTVKKEEIYEDKIEKQKVFIASLGRKNETKGKSENKQPEHVEEKSSLGEKTFFSFLVIVMLGALSGGGYWFWSKEKQKMASEENPKQVIIPVKEEPSPDNSAGEQKVPENSQIEEVKSSEIAIKVLNVGASAGSAGRVKDFLVSKGYVKAEAGNGQETSLAKSYIFYKEGKFKEKAEAVSSLLLKENKISTEVKEADSVEEKSADIVVELGKI